MTTTPKPSPDTVEAIGNALKITEGVDYTINTYRIAYRVLAALNQNGFTITRAEPAMSEAELYTAIRIYLEREKPESAEAAKVMLELAKKYRAPMTEAEPAPLKDEAQAALSDLVPVAEYWKGDHRLVAVLKAHEHTLRAHIAALEAKLAKYTEEPPYKSIRAKLLGNYTAKMKADNKRLLSLLKSANHTYLGDQYVACIDPRAIDAALAQTDGKAESHD